MAAALPATDKATTTSAHHESIAWNERVAAAGGHLLQSWQWGEFKSLHGWSVDRVSVENESGHGLAQILYRKRGPLSIGYIPRGPVVSGDAETIWLKLSDRIDASARAHRAISVIIESDVPLGLKGSFRDQGCVTGPAHLQPGRTVKIPLLSDDEILAGMHQKTRYNVRLAQRRGVEVHRCENVATGTDQFYTLLEDTSDRNEFGIHSKQYYKDFLNVFGGNAALLFAESEGKIGASLIAANFGNEAIYMYGASSTENRAHGAAFLLQFEAMRWGREQECAVYDLWGIPEQDPGPTNGDSAEGATGTKGDDWSGLFRFKTRFGGEIVSYPPTLERRYIPILPWAARKLGIIKG